MRLGSIRLAAGVVMAAEVIAVAPVGAEELSWWLNVFFHVEGEWLPGSEIDGWSAREYETREQCLERKDFAEAECRANPLDYPAQWFCSYGEPLDKPPEPLRGILCMNE